MAQPEFRLLCSNCSSVIGAEVSDNESPSKSSPPQSGKKSRAMAGMDESYIVLTPEAQTGAKAKSPTNAAASGTATARGSRGVRSGNGGRKVPRHISRAHLLNAAFTGLAKVDVTEPDSFPPLSRSYAMAHDIYRNYLDDPQQLPGSLCKECCGYMIGHLMKESKEVRLQKSWMRELRGELMKEQRSHNTGSSQHVKQVEQLLNEQSRVVEALKSIERERETLGREWEELLEEEAALVAEENAYWQEFASLKACLDVFCEQRDSFKDRILHGHKVIKSLRPLHAFNDAFLIWCDGKYGTINSFRLGKLCHPQDKEEVKGEGAVSIRKPPEWSEVNTAWGLTAMLLKAIAENCGFEFAHFDVTTLGAHSLLTRKGRADVKYKLYFDEDGMGNVSKIISGITRSMPKPVESFNCAMAAFVICMSELMDFACKSTTGKEIKLSSQLSRMRIPSSASIRREVYKVDYKSCTVNGWPVEMPSVYSFPDANERSDHAECWTKGLKHVLSNLKWLLVWIVQDKKKQRF